jgi:peptide deformylase
MLTITDDPVKLIKKSKIFDFDNPPYEPIQLIKDMYHTMINNNGIGISHVQIKEHNEPYSVFVINMEPDVKAFFNPVVVGYSDDIISLEEGCLSFPGMICKIKRPRHVRIRFQDENGDTHTELFTGITARVCQHEYDHLNGELFFNKANKYHRDLALKRWKAYIKTKEN